jgi:hypothetical protein
MNFASRWAHARVGATAGLCTPSWGSTLLRVGPEMLAFGLACLIRLIHVSSSDFPLGDGGLFFVMVERVQAAHYQLPVSVEYNRLNIPFAYPPLGFYVTALLADLSGAPIISLMRLFPLAMSFATVAAVWTLARSTLRVRAQTTAAIFAFGMLPLAYRYFIMGAGITRSPGLLFAVLTIWQAYLLCTERSARFIFPTSLAAALTILSHPNAAWFAVYSTGLIFLFFGRDRATFLRGALVGAGALALTSPWWGLVIARHGFAPFVAAPQHTNPGAPAWVLLLTLRLTDEPIIALFAILALLGVLICLCDQTWWLPTWLVAACVLDTRYAGTFAMVPLALLVGVAVGGLGEVVRASRPAEARERALHRGIAAVGVCLAFVSFFGSALLPGPALQALPQTQREAMRWVAAATPVDSRFLIVAPKGASAGSESEWFPVLAGRQSLGTYQGSEWLERQPGPLPWQRYDQLQACGQQDVACLEDWARERGLDFTHVYVRESGTARLRYSLVASLQYSLEYRAPDVWIFAHHKAEPVATQ